MFLTLNHQKLGVYQASKSFVLECYKLSKSLPPEEKFGMISKIRRAALSVHLKLQRVVQENRKQNDNDIMR